MPAYNFEKKLKDAFYFIEKIGDWTRQSGSGQHVGELPIEQVRKFLNAFKAEIAKTGEESIGIAGELPNINYVLDELEKFMTDKPADISSRKAAEIFQQFLRQEFDDLRVTARQMDKERGE